jgi:hypothetical protein
MSQTPQLPPTLKIGIDLDNTITHRPDFFATMTQAMRDAEIHVITDRDPSPSSEQETRAELLELGIRCDRLVITGEKAGYILEAGITIYFDDTDEYFLNLPESVTVFKIREPGNFDFETHQWVYDDRTGRHLRG